MSEATAHCMIEPEIFSSSLCSSPSRMPPTRMTNSLLLVASLIADCGLTYNTFAQYVFLGTEEEAKDVLEHLAVAGVPVTLSRPISTWNEDYVKLTDPEYILPVTWMMPTLTSVGGVPSVLVDRSKNSDLSTFIKGRFSECASKGSEKDGLCNRVEIYHDITGNAADLFPSDDVIVTAAMRGALYHVVSGGSHETMDAMYELLGDNCYQNECAYEISDASGGWKKRVYGEMYEQLLDVKRKYDPENVFWCKHCVGDEE